MYTSLFYVPSTPTGTYPSWSALWHYTALHLEGSWDFKLIMARTVVLIFLSTSAPVFYILLNV